MMDILFYGVVALLSALGGFAVANNRYKTMVHSLQEFLGSMGDTLRDVVNSSSRQSGKGLSLHLQLPDVPMHIPAEVRIAVEQLSSSLSGYSTAFLAHRTQLANTEQELRVLREEYEALEEDYQDVVQHFEQAQKQFDQAKQIWETEQERTRQRVESDQRKLHEELQQLQQAHTHTQGRLHSAEQERAHVLQTVENMQKDLSILHDTHTATVAQYNEAQSALLHTTQLLEEQQVLVAQQKKRYEAEELRLRQESGYNEGKIRQLQGDLLSAKQSLHSMREQNILATTRMKTMEEDVRFLRAEVLRLQELHHEVLVDNDDLSTQIMDQAEKTIAELRQKERDANDFARVLNSAIEQLTNKNKELQSTIESLRMEQARQSITRHSEEEMTTNELAALRVERDQLKSAKEEVDKLFKQLLNKLAQYEANGVPEQISNLESDRVLSHHSAIDALGNITDVIKRDKPVALVVDDSTSNQKILEGILHRCGFTPIFARTGEAGLAMALEHIPDLIVQDLVLPDTDGFKLCEEYKANPATAKIPVIFISSLSDTDAKVRGFELGAVDYITKPFEEAEVSERVKLHYRMRKMETELRLVMRDLEAANNEAEDLYKAKSVFLANMSHELRTPLNAILGFIQILQKDPNITEQQQRYVDTIYSSGAFLLQLINDLLDLSKLEAGKMSLESEVLDLGNLLGSIKEMFALRCAEKELTLSYTIDASVPRSIITDIKRLRQVFVNIVGNAVKFTSKGGITIHATVVDSGSKPLLELSVHDTGRGIPSEQIVSIMEPFSQVRGMKNDGTGLGLSLVHRIVELLNGSLRVESELDKGSIFYITLPLVVPAHDAAPTKIEERKRYVGIVGNHRPKVLIVDDSRTNRLLLRDMLVPIGFPCVEAVDGRDALNKYEEYNPDIVLMDLAMPNMTGDEAMKTIRQKEQKAEHSSVMIAITASIIRRDIQRLIDEGFDAVLMKPFLIDDLFALIAQFVGIEFITQVIPSTPQVTNSNIPDDVSNAVLIPYFRALPQTLQTALEDVMMEQDFTAIMLHLKELSSLINDMQNTSEKEKLQILYDVLQREASAENNLFFSKFTDALLIA